MEPDQVKTLREKINTLEHQPVSWQKEFVWQQVAHTAARQSHTPRWSYAAALAIMGMIGYFMLSYQQRNRDAAAWRISFLEKEIASRENNAVLNQNNIEEVCVEENNVLLTGSSNSITKKPVLAEDQPVSNQELQAITIRDSIIISTTNMEAVASVEATPQLKTIMPIIGKIPLRMPDLSGEERTVRIYINKKDNPELLSSPEEQPVFVARIN
jgi:hypothetical protein